VSERWEEFKSEEEALPDENASRLAQRNSDKRYDYWRVSLNALADAPAGGVGAGGFEREYIEHRRHAKPSQAAHSIWFRALSETGLVGAALLLLLVATLAAGLARAWRLGDGARAAAAAAAGVGGYFLVHASFDWLELFPALAAPALGFALAAMVAAEPVGGVKPRRLVSAAALVAATAALASLALPYLSLRLVDAGRDLDLAADLDPLSPDPHLARGTLALRRADFTEAERAFRRALEVEDGWYPHFQLALLASREGRRAEAQSEIELAGRLNPPDPLVKRAAELIADGKRIDPRAVDRDNVELRLYNAPRGH
jgi:tetratricopeptide (TPR) repeat protein